MTAFINKLKDKTGNQQLPVTHERAVRDDNGTTLESKMQNLEGAMDKAYVASSDNGMGRITLKKNMVSGVNTLTQAMMQATNTIYIIQYDFTLGSDIKIPTNCVLEFDGGSISGERTITGNNTDIKAGKVKIFSSDIILDGTWIVDGVRATWFGVINTGTDESSKLQSALDNAHNIRKGVILDCGCTCTTDITIYKEGLFGDTIGSDFIRIEGNIVFDSSIRSVGADILRDIYAHNITVHCLGFGLISNIRCINFNIIPLNNEGVVYCEFDNIFCEGTFTINITNGWCNANNFRTVIANVKSDAYGLKIIGSSIDFNSNTFLNCDFSHTLGVYSESEGENTFINLYLEGIIKDGVTIQPELQGKWDIYGIIGFDTTVDKNISRASMRIPSSCSLLRYVPVGDNLLDFGDFSYVNLGNNFVTKLDGTPFASFGVDTESPTKVMSRIYNPDPTDVECKIPIGKIHSNSLYITLITRNISLYHNSLAIGAEGETPVRWFSINGTPGDNKWHLTTVGQDLLHNDANFSKEYNIYLTVKQNQIFDIAYIYVSDASIKYPTIGKNLIFETYVVSGGKAIEAGSSEEFVISSFSKDIIVRDIQFWFNPHTGEDYKETARLKRSWKMTYNSNDTITYSLVLTNETASQIYTSFAGRAYIHITRDYIRY